MAVAEMVRRVVLRSAPVAAVMETEDGVFCWVQAKQEPQKRLIELGDSNDVFIEVVAGLNEGEEVVLNPTALLKEAEEDALTTLNQYQHDARASDGRDERDAANSGEVQP